MDVYSVNVRKVKPIFISNRERERDLYIILIERCRGCDIDCEIVTKTNDYKASTALCSSSSVSQSGLRRSASANQKGESSVRKIQKVIRLRLRLSRRIFIEDCHGDLIAVYSMI